MKKIVITGIGMVTPVGNGKDASWSALKAGTCGIGRITKFDASRCTCQVAGELKDFDAYLAETGCHSAERSVSFGSRQMKHYRCPHSRA